MQPPLVLLLLLLIATFIVSSYAAAVCSPLEGYCRSDHELCPNNEACASGTCVLGRCARNLSGLRCDNDKDCIGGFASDVFCVGGKCTTRRTLNSKCSEGSQCWSGLCSKETPFVCLGLPAGYSCVSNAQCAYNMRCVQSVCVQSAPIGAECTTASDCGSATDSDIPVVCLLNRCTALFPQFSHGDISSESCQFDGNCQTTASQACTCLYDDRTIISRVCATLNVSISWCASQWRSLTQCKATHQCAHWSNGFHSNECVTEHCSDELIDVSTCPISIGLVPPLCAKYITATLSSIHQSSSAETTTSSSKSNNNNNKEHTESRHLSVGTWMFILGIALALAIIATVVFEFARKDIQSVGRFFDRYLGRAKSTTKHQPVCTEMTE